LIRGYSQLGMQWNEEMETGVSQAEEAQHFLSADMLP
jgi:hypothetical protein